jgi:hypothetical protein
MDGRMLGYETKRHRTLKSDAFGRNTDLVKLFGVMG